MKAEEILACSSARHIDRHMNLYSCDAAVSENGQIWQIVIIKNKLMLDFDVSSLFNFDDEFHHHDNIFYF